jgi:hypothetical protein
MTSTPAGTLRVDSITASAPSSARIAASTSRMSGATNRLMFMTTLLD